jgi:hypothetical protein
MLYLFYITDRAKRMKSYKIGLKEKMTFTDYVFSPVKKGTIGQQIRTITDDCVPVVDIYFMNRKFYNNIILCNALEGTISLSTQNISY